MDGRLEAQGLRPRPEEPLSDRQLDREIESAVGIDPSPDFLARVRTRIAGEPEPFAGSGYVRIRQLAFEPLWRLAIVGIVLTIVVPQFMRKEPEPPTMNLVRGADVAPPPVETVVARHPENAQVRQRRVTMDRVQSPRTLPLQLSPVLFAEEDQRAFALFVTAVGEGRVLEEVARRSDESAIDAALSIEPLVIAPLSPLARAAQEGADQWE